jgi:hypothetical protein
LMRVWGNLADRLLCVRRHPVNCLVRQRGDAISGRVSKRSQSFGSVVSNRANPEGG